MKLFCALLASASLVGCSHSPEAIRARQQERARLARCYSIEVYQYGMLPQRRYRELGTIGVDREDNPSLRIRELQQRACQLGADAIVDIRDLELPDPGVARVPAYPGNGPDAPYRTVTAMAVQWLDAEPAPPPTTATP